MKTLSWFAVNIMAFCLFFFEICNSENIFVFFVFFHSLTSFHTYISGWKPTNHNRSNYFNYLKFISFLSYISCLIDQHFFHQTLSKFTVFFLLWSTIIVEDTLFSLIIKTPCFDRNSVILKSSSLTRKYKLLY